MYCKLCDEGDEPQLLDIDGVQGSKSGSTDVCWAHAYEDDWWPCQAKAAEEHAEVERLRTAARQVSTLLNLGDQRLLASDGPCGGLNAATALSAEESAELYQACQRIAAGAVEPTEDNDDEECET